MGGGSHLDVPPNTRVSRPDVRGGSSVVRFWQCSGACPGLVTNLGAIVHIAPHWSLGMFAGGSEQATQSYGVLRRTSNCEMLHRSSRWWVGLGHFCPHGRTEDRLQGSHQVSQGLWQSPTCTVVSVMGFVTHAHRSDPCTAVRNMTSAEFRPANSYARQMCASSCQAMPPALWHAFRGHPWLGPLTFVVPLRQDLSSHFCPLISVIP